jgi:hypothetical protein
MKTSYLSVGILALLVAAGLHPTVATAQLTRTVAQVLAR